jgi:hypothetical protein
LSREYLVKEESLSTALARVELKVYHLYLRCISLGGEYGDWFRSSRPKMYHFHLRVTGHEESRASGLGQVELNLPIFPP